MSDIYEKKKERKKRRNYSLAVILLFVYEMVVSIRCTNLDVYNFF